MIAENDNNDPSTALKDCQLISKKLLNDKPSIMFFLSYKRANFETNLTCTNFDTNRSTIPTNN